MEGMSCLKGSWNLPLEMFMLRPATLYKKNHWEAELTCSDPSDPRLSEGQMKMVELSQDYVTGWHRKEIFKFQAYPGIKYTCT